VEQPPVTSSQGFNHNTTWLPHGNVYGGEAITASNIKNIKFEIRNNKLDQIQGISAKMAANGIRTHARTNQWCTLESRLRQSLNWESNCRSWPIELSLAFQVLASKSKLIMRIAQISDW